LYVGFGTWAYTASTKRTRPHTRPRQKWGLARRSRQRNTTTLQHTHVLRGKGTQPTARWSGGGEGLRSVQQLVKICLIVCSANPLSGAIGALRVSGVRDLKLQLLRFQEQSRLRISEPAPTPRAPRRAFEARKRYLQNQ